ncbi:MAG: ribonuclease III [Actinomycetota bacterium]|jgi:ribonuclease III|nr:ribonuclease III [Actinomycetota bacterium]
MPDLSQLSARLGYAFTDSSLLETAMHHRSWNAENDGGESNERLEFLGDAVLGWVVADIVYSQHSDLPEGKLTDLRKSVVNALALAEVAAELGIGEHLMLGKGEDAAGGREKTSILSDALEAVIGAMYIDAGPQVTHRVVSELMGTRIVDAVGGLDRLDAKTRLQELASRLEAQVHYKVKDEGPDHDKMFFATVFVGDRELGYGEGKSKKAAEQIAAEIACDVLNAELAAE